MWPKLLAPPLGFQRGPQCQRLSTERTERCPQPGRASAAKHMGSAFPCLCLLDKPSVAQGYQHILMVSSHGYPAPVCTWGELSFTYSFTTDSNQFLSDPAPTTRRAISALTAAKVKRLSKWRSWAPSASLPSTPNGYPWLNDGFMAGLNGFNGWLKLTGDANQL